MSLDENRSNAGSSPLARGKGKSAVAYTVANGIIPACAGKRSACGSVWYGLWDHPRLRGEKQNEMPTAVDDLGSSPLARGKVLDMDYTTLMEGIIPACAGKR